MTDDLRPGVRRLADLDQAIAILQEGVARRQSASDDDYASFRDVVGVLLTRNEAAALLRAVEPATAARESRALTKGVDAMNADELAEVIAALSDALWRIRALKRGGWNGDFSQDDYNDHSLLMAVDVDTIIDDALAETGLE